MPALVIAHRGGAALAPENTLAAFANAKALGADGAELDVHLTRDGQVVVAHDFRVHRDLARNENGEWLDAPTPRIRDLTAAELAQFEVGRARPGSAYAGAHPQMIPCDGERIPLLTEVIECVRFAPKTFWLFVELKTSLAAPPEDLADATVFVLRKAGYIEHSVLVGFDWRALLRAKSIAPSLACWFSTRPQSWFADDNPPAADDPPPRPALEMLRHWARTGTSPWAAGFDAVRHDGSMPAAIKAAGAQGWFPYWRDVTAGSVAEAHALGLKVGAWTVDDPGDIHALAKIGVDAICTDRPDVMLRTGTS